MASRAKRLVLFSPMAASDVAHTYEYTAHYWGVSQAESYSAMLIAVAQSAANEETFQGRVQGFPELCFVFAKWPGAKYGHNIVFERVSDGIYVHRVLHSAMDMPTHLRTEET